MSKFDIKLIEAIKNENLYSYLMSCNFGLERENARVDKNGTLAFTPHPAAFGDRLKNYNIKTDFSESQIELATDVCSTLEETYDFLGKLHEKVYNTIAENDEYLWMQSAPPRLPKGQEIPIAKMGNFEEEKFRKVLAEKYGKKKQLISGIHYNFSFNEELIKKLYTILSEGEDFKSFKNRIYLKICRNFIKYRWLLIYLTGASPVFHSSFIAEYVKRGKSLDKESFYFQNMISLRNSEYGYKNREDFYVSYDSVEQYLTDIEALVKRGELQDICEFYSPVRIKTGNNDALVNELLEDGIRYIEIRILDINPLERLGISKEVLYLVHLFILYMLFLEDSDLDKKHNDISNINANLVALKGREEGLKLKDKNGTEIYFKKLALEAVKDLRKLIELLALDSFKSIVEDAEDMINNSKIIPSNKIFEGIKEKSFINFNLEKVKEYLK